MQFVVGRERVPGVGSSSSASASVYLVKDDIAINLSTADATIGSDLRGLMSHDDLSRSVSAAVLTAPQTPLNRIIPELPVANPGKIICLGLNYKDHIKEGGYAIPDYPALFMRGLNSLMPAGKPMIRPHFWWAWT
jgi:2-keto-4-pentenoate hydratase/2-oxohepta-3-ene-1,7-dioic acid hydratase in catechol pathway